MVLCCWTSPVLFLFSKKYVANSSAKTSGGLFGNGLSLLLLVSLFMSSKRPLVSFSVVCDFLHYALLLWNWSSLLCPFLSFYEPSRGDPSWICFKPSPYFNNFPLFLHVLVEVCLFGLIIILDCFSGAILSSISCSLVLSWLYAWLCPVFSSIVAGSKFWMSASFIPFLLLHIFLDVGFWLILK